jgi:gliding motility-associated lipoprotein GldD
LKTDASNGSKSPFPLLLPLSFLLAVFSSCEQDYQPKPFGYFRIGVPTRDYGMLKSDCPYTFEMNESAEWVAKDNCWGDVRYPGIRATLQLTYKQIGNQADLTRVLKESQDLAYKHTVAAQGIGEKLYSNPGANVHGILYQMQGNAASSTQFFVTDSSSHFLRGVLYFYSAPNADSLKPVNAFMYGEMVHLIETLEWKNSSQLQPLKMP